MQPKFTQRNLWYFCAKTVTLFLFLAAFNQLTFAQEKLGAPKSPKDKYQEQLKARIESTTATAAPSVGPAPVQEGAKGIDILPDAGNPVSRAWCYNGGPGTFQLNRQSLLSTALTPIGAGVPFGFPGAAAWVTTTNLMYVVDQAAPFALYRVDTLTGVRTFVANCTGVPHANLTGITFDPSTNTMYGVSSSISASQIFTINMTTGVCTPIGSPTSVAPGVIMINAAPGGTLFSADIVNDNLYKWNKTTGVPTLVGPLGFNANFGQDAHFDFSDGQYFYACYNATAGQPQLRIVDTLTGGSTLVGTYVSQVETFAIYTPPQPPCTGTPTPGNTIASTAAACPGDLLTLSLQNYTPGSQITYQWQSAPAAAGPWVSNGPTSASWSLLQTAATWYRCIVTCVASGNSGTSTPVQVAQNPFTNCYCNSVAASNADEEIFNVTFGTLNNSSTCATTAPGPGSINRRYSNYRTITPGNVVTGTMPISVQVGTCGGNFGSAVGVWLDMNHNGVFDHPAERIFLSNTTTGPHIASGLATIPPTALSGVTGMRVINVETGVPANITPCGPYTWGETEDYLINIQPCVPITTVSNPTTFTTQCSGTATLTASAGSASFPTWTWEYRVNSASPWQNAVAGGLGGVISSANTNVLTLINVPSTLSGYQFRPVVTNPCTAIDFGQTSTLTVTPLVATVNPTAATICSGTIIPLTLTNASTPATSTFSSVAGLPLNIPDNNANGVTNTLTVAGLPGTSVVTGIVVTFNMTHTWVGDVVMNLRAPNGQTINLFGLLDGGTGSNGTANFVNTRVSSDNSLPPMSGAPAPRNGIFRADRYNTVGVGPNVLPTNTGNWALLAPNGAAANGVWTLGICDLGPADLGILQSWSVSLTYGAPAAGVWTSAPAAPNTMWLDPAATVPYPAGSNQNTIYVNPATNTNYSVVYSTVAPACTSAPTVIPVTVIQPLGAVVQPTSKSVCVGGTTTFSITAPGGPFTYQWQETRNNGLTWSNITDGGVYSGATTNTLTLTGVTRSAPVDMNNFRYRVNVTTTPCAGSFTSNEATLTVWALPTVTISATDLALLPNQTSTITGTSNPAPGAVPNWAWTRDGAPIAGAATSSVIADIDRMGVYQATVTDINGCRNSSNQLLIEAEAGDKLWIYPNPTSGAFQIRLYYPGVITEKRRIQIFNSAGAEVMSRDIMLSNVSSPHYQRFDVDLGFQPGGVYLVRVIDMYTKKAISGFVIKQTTK